MENLKRIKNYSLNDNLPQRNLLGLKNNKP